MKHVLVVCDSHGSDYGAETYATRIKQSLQRTTCVDILSFGGKPISQIHEEVKAVIVQHYDFCILQVGNPDVHPRMPWRLLKGIRSVGIRFVRDSWFSVPPKWQYRSPVKFPLFILRLCLIRVVPSYYASISDIIHSHIKLYDMLSENCDLVLSFPLFEVNEFVYGSSHNQRARAVNCALSRHYGHKFVTLPILSPKVYKLHFNHDCFHFRDSYHRLLGQSISNEFFQNR